MRLPTLSACLIFLGWGSLAMAADTTEPGGGRVEEVVVTTRGWEEDLQQVPIAITALDGEAIANAGVKDLKGLIMRSPSLSFNEALSQNDLRITVRGLTNIRGRSNVAFLIDGIDVTSENTGTSSGSPLLVNQRMLNDIERVEIVRGPQSALFGRAAFAGAISYVTREPGAEFESRVGIDLADYGGREVSGTISMPLAGETLGMRLNGLAWSDDGAYVNSVSGADVGGGDGTGFAATLVYRPVADAKVKARFTYSDDHYDIRPVAIVPRSAVLDVPAPPPDSGIRLDPTVSLVENFGSAEGRQVFASEDPLTGGEYPGTQLEVFRGTVVAEWRLDNVTLQSYTGLTDARLEQRYDLDRQADGRPDQIFGHNDVDTRDTTDQFSQEFRVLLGLGSDLDLTTGVLYWTEDRESLSRNLIVVCSDLVTPGGDVCREPFGGGSGPYTSWQEIYADITELVPDTRIPTRGDTDHGSIYARLDWRPLDTVTLSLEDRYVNEEFFGLVSPGSTCNNFYPDSGPVGFGPIQPIPGPSFNFGCGRRRSESGTVRTDYHTPKATITWQASDDVLGYASAGKGEKPGGISLLVIPAPLPQPIESLKFDPETMWAYELGVKTRWDGRFGGLTVNAAAFLQDYTDKQVTINRLVGFFPVPFTTNASSAEVFGLELETQWDMPVEGMMLSVAYTWLNAEYKDFEYATTDEGPIAIQGNCDQVDYLYEGQQNPGDRLGCVVNNDGETLEFAPTHALATQFSYRRPFGSTGVDLFLEADARFQDEVFTGAPNFTVQDNFWRCDLRTGIDSGKVRLTAYLNNVFDDDTINASGGVTDFGAVAVDAGGPTNIQSVSYATLPQPRTFGLRLVMDF